ncbi:hypothetical protein ACMFMG_001615 [Clarireedia jacksonii]
MGKGFNESLPISSKALGDFQDVHLGSSSQQPNGQVHIEHSDMQRSQVGKKTLRRRWWILVIIIAVIISVLVTAIVFMPTSKQWQAPSSSVVQQHTTTVPLETADIVTTKNTARTTRMTRRYASDSQDTPTSLSAPILTLCLDVLEDVCAMKDSRDLSTFADCEALYVYFYCPLIDMTVHRDAIQTSSSFVCPAMKTFCERSSSVKKELRR